MSLRWKKYEVLRNKNFLKRIWKAYNFLYKKSKNKQKKAAGRVAGSVSGACVS